MLALLLHAALMFGATPAPSTAPSTWAVIVGVGEVADANLAPVAHAAADAEAIRDWLTSVGRVPSDHVVLLADGGAPFFDPAAPVMAAPTRRNARLALGAWLGARVKAGDRVLVAWSGEGATGAAGEPLLVTSDAARDDLAGTAVDARWIATTVGGLGASAVLWLDTSFSGRGATRATSTAVPPPSGARATTAGLVPGKRGATWLAAPVGARAVEAASAPHGAFTAALLAALRARSTASDAELWARVVAALPPEAPRPVRLGADDIVKELVFPATTVPARERPELVLQTPHVGRVEHAVFDPTGRLLATTGDDGELKLWSVATHEVVANLDMPGPGGLIDWSPDGERVLARAPNGVAVWSAAGRLLWTLQLPAEAWPADVERIQLFVQAPVRFSPDGKLVAVPRRDARAELRDAASGDVVARLPDPVSGPIAWDPRGDRLAYTKLDDATVRVAAWPGLKVLATLPAAGGAKTVGALAFGADPARTLVVGRVADGEHGDFPRQDVTLYAGAKGYRPRPTAEPLGCRLPPATRGDVLVLPDEATRVVRLGTLEVATLADGGFAQLTPDGRRLAFYMADDTRIYDLAALKLERSVEGEAIAVSPDLGAVLAGTSTNHGDGLALRDASGRAPPTPMLAPARPILGLRLVPASPQGPGRLVAAEADRAIAWDLATGRPSLATSASTSTITSTSTSASAGTPAAVAAAMAGIANVRAVAWSPDRARVAVIDDAGILRAIDAATGAVSAPQATGVRRADDLVFVDATRVALHAETRFPDMLCRTIEGLQSARCRAWDAAPDPGEGDIVLWDLARGARHGVLTGHRGAVTGLVALPDGKTLVSSGIDTTLRLWDVATARPLATVALLGDLSRWVVTAPDGLFDGSPDGQAAMQWRVGDALFRLEQYAGDFYTPGLLRRLLAGDRPRASAAIEDLRPPPRVRIASPERGAALTAGVAKVVVRVDDVGGGASAPWLYVNGHRVPPTRSRPLGGPSTVFEVELVEGPNLLRATAFNGDGSVESAGDEIAVTWSVPLAERPTLHLLAVGVDAYDDPALRLSFATADAKAIADAFTPGLFGAVDKTVLVDAQATRGQIRAALARIAAVAHPRDAVLVYLAGHGTLVGSTFYYLPVEARAASDDDVARTGLSQADLGEALTQIAATKQVVVLDACHSGAGATALGRMVAAGGERDAMGLARAQRRLARASGVFLVAAATAEQKAGEIRELGHGVLTYAILAGLGAAGKPPAAALTPDGQVTVTALLAYLDEEVPRLTAQHHGGAQNPVQATTGQDFPIIEAPRP